MKTFATLLAISAVALPALPAQAQDAGDDWDLHQASQGGLTQAVLAYEGAPILTARCASGLLQVIIGDLPPVTSETRELSLEYGDAKLTHWRVMGGSGVTDLNAMTMRTLMAGGELILTVRDSQPPRRYRLHAPVMSPAIGRVLSACGAALSSDRDAAVRARLLMAEQAENRPSDFAPITWVRRPLPQYPETALQRDVISGLIVLNCYAKADGGLRDCVVDTEYPVGFDFGAEALRSTRDARMTPRPADPNGTDPMVSFSLFLQADLPKRDRAGH
ncbi:MAG: hypothetical protein J0M36_11205 [Caulobacterales bacterium]|nr:hypothetical protein [Caulobacterales bacterium]